MPVSEGISVGYNLLSQSLTGMCVIDGYRFEVQNKKIQSCMNTWINVYSILKSNIK